MDLQLVRLVKALIRGEKLPDDERPTQKVHHKNFNGGVIAAAQVLTFPTGKVKRVRLSLGNTYTAGISHNISTINLLPGALCPLRGEIVLGGVAWAQLLEGWAAASIGHPIAEWKFHSIQALESPTITCWFTAAMADIHVEVEYE